MKPWQAEPYESRTLWRCVGVMLLLAIGLAAVLTGCAWNDKEINRERQEKGQELTGRPGTHYQGIYGP